MLSWRILIEQVLGYLLPQEDQADEDQFRSRRRPRYNPLSSNVALMLDTNLVVQKSLVSLQLSEFFACVAQSSGAKQLLSAPHLPHLQSLLVTIWWLKPHRDGTFWGPFFSVSHKLFYPGRALCRASNISKDKADSAQALWVLVQVPTLLKLFVEIERTGRHNQFYEKFEVRLDIGRILSKFSSMPSSSECAV